MSSTSLLGSTNSSEYKNPCDPCLKAYSKTCSEGATIIQATGCPGSCGIVVVEAGFAIAGLIFAANVFGGVCNEDATLVGLAIGSVVCLYLPACCRLSVEHEIPAACTGGKALLAATVATINLIALLVYAASC